MGNLTEKELYEQWEREGCGVILPRLQILVARLSTRLYEADDEIKKLTQRLNVLVKED